MNIDRFSVYIDNSGSVYHYLNNQLHRVGGPAVEWVSGYKEWHIDNKLHRLDGPAVECQDGRKYWYYNDVYIDVNSQKEFEQYLKLMAFT